MGLIASGQGRGRGAVHVKQGFMQQGRHDSDMLGRAPACVMGAAGMFKGAFAFQQLGEGHLWCRQAAHHWQAQQTRQPVSALVVAQGIAGRYNQKTWANKCV